VGLPQRQREGPRRDPHHRQSRTPSCRNRLETGQELAPRHATHCRRLRAFFEPPATLWWARIAVPSRKAIPSAMPRSCASRSRRSHAPRRDHRIKGLRRHPPWPEPGGDSAPLAPLRYRQMMAPSSAADGVTALSHVVGRLRSAAPAPRSVRPST
jgi:hypothetical protein